MEALLIIYALFIPVGGIFFWYSRKPKAEKLRIMNKFYSRMHKFLSRFFLTYRYYLRIQQKLANLSIYRKDELRRESVKYFLWSWGSSIVLAVVMILLFNNILIILIGVGFTIFLSNIVIDKRLDGVYLRVLVATAHALDAVRQEYSRTNSVVDALNEAEYPDIIKRPMETISNILTGTNGEIRLQEFIESTPFRPLQTFASICFSINNDGDETDELGRSNFSQAITLLIGDVNSEIQRITFRKLKFGYIEYMPLVVIPAVPLCTMFLTSTMPGVALVYNGIIGQVIQTAVVFASILCYTVVSRINCNIPMKEDDRSSFVERLLENRRFYRFVYTLTPKNKKRALLERKLKAALSKMTIEHFYAKKILFAGFSILLSIMTIILAVSISKDFLRHSTQQLSLIASDNTPAFDREKMKEMDAIYLQNPKAYNDDQIAQLVRSHLPLLTDLQVYEQVSRMKSKAKNLENAYFHWYYLLIAYATGVVGWFAPNRSLKMRRDIAATEAQEDFLQLQTLTSILMNTNTDTLGLLHQFARNSRIHKDMFVYAALCYPSNPELEISRLQSKTPIYEFKRFLGKLKLTINELSIREAFESLLLEREHVVKMREMTTQAAIMKKRRMAGKLALIPLGFMIIGVFLFPIGYLGALELMGAFKTLG